MKDSPREGMRSQITVLIARLGRPLRVQVACGGLVVSQLFFCLELSSQSRRFEMLTRGQPCPLN